MKQGAKSSPLQAACSAGAAALVRGHFKIAIRVFWRWRQYGRQTGKAAFFGHAAFHRGAFALVAGERILVIAAFHAVAAHGQVLFHDFVGVNHGVAGAVASEIGADALVGEFLENGVDFDHV